MKVPKGYTGAFSQLAVEKHPVKSIFKEWLCQFNARVYIIKTCCYLRCGN